MSIDMLILGVSLKYWLIMLASHSMHVYMKVEADVRENKVAIKDYLTTYKFAGLLFGLYQSIVLLYIGSDALIKYTQNVDTTASVYISFIVAFIGYGGSSLWNNIMELIKAKFNLK
jgi:hypothetical protein